MRATLPLKAAPSIQMMPLGKFTLKLGARCHLLGRYAQIWMTSCPRAVLTAPRCHRCVMASVKEMLHHLTAPLCVGRMHTAWARLVLLLMVGMGMVVLPKRTV